MMEQAAVRPLDGLEAFLPLWLERLRTSPLGTRGSMTSDLIREATLRVEGVDGLARIATEPKTLGRATDSAGDGVGRDSAVLTP
jgi:hypothetical protein